MRSRDVRRLACYHNRDGDLVVVVNSQESKYPSRMRLDEAIFLGGIEDFLGGNWGVLWSLGQWLKEPATRLNIKFNGRLFVAELWQDDKMMASASINDLDAVMLTIEGLAHKLLIWKKSE